MTSEEAHRKSIRTLIEDVEEKMHKGIAEERQKLIGFACSEASCDLMALLLHGKKIIEPGFNVNHRFFASEKMAEAQFDYAFPSKEKLIPLLVKQEEYRNFLCYGKPKESKLVSSCVENIFKIKEIIEKELGEKI